MLLDFLTPVVFMIFWATGSRWSQTLPAQGCLAAINDLDI